MKLATLSWIRKCGTELLTDPIRFAVFDYFSLGCRQYQKGQPPQTHRISDYFSDGTKQKILNTRLRIDYQGYERRQRSSLQVKSRTLSYFHFVN